MRRQVEAKLYRCIYSLALLASPPPSEPLLLNIRLEWSQSQYLARQLERRNLLTFLGNQRRGHGFLCLRPRFLPGIAVDPRGCMGSTSSRRNQTQAHPICKRMPQGQISESLGL